MKIKRSYKNAGISAVCICLSMVMVLNTIQPLRKAEARVTPEMGPKVSVVFSSRLNEERTSADVTIVASPAQAEVEVVGINLPDGSYIDGNQAVYTAVSNGWQDFTVIYDELVEMIDGEIIATSPNAGQDDAAGQGGGTGQGNSSGQGSNAGQGSGQSEDTATSPNAGEGDTADEGDNADEKGNTVQPEGVSDAERSDVLAGRAFSLGQMLLPKAYALTVKNHQEIRAIGSPNLNTNITTQEEKSVQSGAAGSDQGTIKDNSSNVGSGAGKPGESGAEAVKPSESGTEPEAEKPSESGTEPEAVKPSESGAEPEAGNPSESGAEPEVEKPSESGAEPEVEKPSEAGAEPEVEKPSESGAEPEVEKPSESGAKPEAEIPSESGAETETGKPSGSDNPSVGADTPVTPNMGPGVPNQKPIPDFEKEESDLPVPEMQLVRRSQVFQYEVTGIGEEAHAFEQRKAFAEDGLEVLVKAGADVFPEGATAEITRVTDEEQTDKLQTGMRETLPETEFVFQTVFYDIVIRDKDGKEIQPDRTKGEVKVVFNKLNTPREASEEEKEDGVEEVTVLDEPEELDTNRKIVVFDERNKAEFLETIETSGGIEAEAPHFSVYGVATTRGWTQVLPINNTHNGKTTDLVHGKIYTVTPSGNSTVLELTHNGTVFNVKSGRTVVINVPKGITLRVRAQSIGSPAIWLAPGGTLIVTGGGTLVANGGPGTNGQRGIDGSNARYTGIPSQWNDQYGWYMGAGGAGGNGGKGGGAGIGGGGGGGGTGGSGGRGWKQDSDIFTRFGGINRATETGQSGTSGQSGGGMGDLWVFGATVEGNGGNAGTPGGIVGSGSRAFTGDDIWIEEDGKQIKPNYGVSPGGGGGSGAGGSKGWGIGSGGGGGGGGGGGNSGAIASTLVYDTRTANVFLAGAGGGGGGGLHSPGMYGHAASLSGATLTPDGIKLEGTRGNAGTSTSGGAGGYTNNVDIKYRLKDRQDVVLWQHQGKVRAGSGGAAGGKGNPGKVYKSADAVVRGREDGTIDTDGHDALKYRLDTVVSPAGKGSISGGGSSYMYGSTVTLTANDTEGYWIFNNWDGGSTQRQLTAKIDKFQDVTRTAHFREKRLHVRESHNGNPVGSADTQIVRSVKDGTSFGVDFKVFGDDNRPISAQALSDIVIRNPGGQTVQTDWTVTWLNDTVKIRAAAGKWDAGVYEIQVKNNTTRKKFNLIKHKVDAPTTGSDRDKIITLKSAATAGENDIASDSVMLTILTGNGSNASQIPMSIQRIGVGAGQKAIQIVSKDEVKRNKNTWGPADANNKIALEVNGQPYRAGISLQPGVNTFKVYNANNTTATADRTLRLYLPNQSSGSESFIEIDLKTEPAPMKTLTIRPEVVPMENNPITGAVQTMGTPVLTGANGQPQPEITQYRLSAPEPGPGYFFAGWFEDTGTKVSGYRDIVYTIPPNHSSMTLKARYVPWYELQRPSVGGDYLVSDTDNSFSHIYRVERIQDTDNITGNHSVREKDLAIVRKNGSTEQIVDKAKITLLSWMNKDINVRFDGLEAGIFYPKMKGLTQGQTHPGGADREWITLSKFGFANAPGATEAKKSLTMKASSAVNQVATDSILVTLDTPYPAGDITSFRLLRVSAGTADHPLEIVGREEIDTHKLDWGWGKAQTKIGMTVNDQPIFSGGIIGRELKVGTPNTVKLYNANGLKDTFSTEVVFEVELTTRNGGTKKTKLTIPINVQPTQIQVAVPLAVQLVTDPGGKIVSPDVKIRNSTALPLTVGAVKVERIGPTNLEFVPVKPGNNEMNKLYGVLNIRKTSGTDQIVLANLQNGANHTVDWKLEPGSASAPSELAMDFKDSRVSAMTGGWPTTAAEIFRLSYTVSPIKE